jgi:hypothetical protein
MKLVSVLAVVFLVASFASASADSPAILLDVSRLSSLRPAPADATRVTPRTPRMPAQLAASQDADKRAGVEQMYGKLLSTFEQGFSRHHLPSNDVAVAGASLIAVAYQAVSGTEVSDAGVMALIGQLRDLLAATPSFTHATMAQRQDLYEMFLITAGILAVGVGSDGSRAQSRAAGEGSLKSLLGISAAEIEIDDHGMRLVGGGGEGRGPGKEPAPADASPRSAPAGDAPAAEPRAELPSSKLEALLWKFEVTYEAFPANSMVAKEYENVLFSDGTCASGAPSSLVGYEPDPKRDCKWRKKGASYELRWHGNRWRFAGDFTVLRPAKPGERISGSWTRKRTSTIGTGAALRMSQLVLRRDGTFAFEASGAYTTNSDVNATEPVVTGAYDTEGSTATISSAGVGGKITTRTGRGAGDTSGTYRLDGFVIELQFASGRTERHMFAMAPELAFIRLDGIMMPSK